MGELEGTLGALLKGITARVIGELVKTYGWKTAVLYMALAFAALFAAALAIRAIYKIARFALISAQRIFRKLNPQVAKASLVVTAAVTLGLLPLPYSYYILLRIIVCISAALAYAHANAHKRNNWQFIAGAIVVLYNPFVPVHLGDKGLWVLINAATVIMLWSAAYQLRSTVKKLGTYAPRTQEQDDPTWPDGDKDSRAFEQALAEMPHQSIRTTIALELAEELRATPTSLQVLRGSHDPMSDEDRAALCQERRDNPMFDKAMRELEKVTAEVKDNQLEEETP